MSIQVAFGRHFADDGAGRDVAHVGRLFEVGDVESEHDVDALVAAVRIHRQVKRVIARKVQAGTDIPNRSAEGLSQFDDVIPAVRRAGGEVGDDRHPIRGG